MRRGRRGHLCATAAMAAIAATSWIGAGRATSAAVFQNSPPPSQEPAAQAGGSILDGVFTPGQASRGERMFQQVCTACHTADEHTGRRFAGKWAGASMGELLELVSSTMPETDPGSLQPAEYASILAYFLRESGYPAGEQELASEPAALMKVRIEPLEK